MWSLVAIANLLVVTSLIPICNGARFTGRQPAKIKLPMGDRKASPFTALSKAGMKTLSLKVMKTLTQTLPNICLERCKEEESCSNAIHCLANEQTFGTCYLMGAHGAQLESRTNCKISKPGQLSIILSEEPNTDDHVLGDNFHLSRFQNEPAIEMPKELQTEKHQSEQDTSQGTKGEAESNTNAHDLHDDSHVSVEIPEEIQLSEQETSEETKAEPEKEIPEACLTEPSYMNQGAVRKQKSHKPGYPVVIEYECGRQGQWTYEYVTGTTEATCDEDGKWTLPALMCISTNCYHQQRNGRNVTKAWYAGSVSGTSAGLTCQKWTSNTPHSHRFKNKRNTQFPGDASADDAGNKCRDTDGESRPWCYTTEASKRWESCPVSKCDDGFKCGTPPYQPGTYPIRTEIKNNYIHVTYSCLDGLTYTGGDVTAACNISSGVWKWPKLLCSSQECYYYDSQLSGKAIYKGDISSTKSGKTCQRFDSQTPHKHGYSDEISDFPGETSLADIGNKCRDGDGEGAPWCYTTDPDKRWDYCGIPECLFDLKQHRVINS